MVDFDNDDDEVDDHLFYQCICVIKEIEFNSVFYSEEIKIKITLEEHVVFLLHIPYCTLTNHE